MVVEKRLGFLFAYNNCKLLGIKKLRFFKVTDNGTAFPFKRFLAFSVIFSANFKAL